MKLSTGWCIFCFSILTNVFYFDFIFLQSVCFQHIFFVRMYLLFGGRKSFMRRFFPQKEEGRSKTVGMP
ncbi:MAG: hypothetical protein A3F54_04820 [Candidatus Kerfeldbacteria bacterium RIFCSPHIGHO2_12_FULL_48_17]|uniref:Uncharacterized protein n=1 Tax=Candidatus Kerfeldbacteria bacterium RIFCSPHIGHO2_12_FULL_48_17 TaxID=1798542 RepID=A0A1G2B603_9BACT|nr:MAG: hypothetical protein A3F54_04820 [Candidatus Kerfeldbacteria bacterium RIFCSPHIGHO2_12_FULL_48_17]